MPSFLPHGLEVFLPLSAHLEHLSTDPLQVGGAAIPTPMRAAISHKRPVAYHSPGTSHRSTFSLARESNTEAPHSCLRRAGLESLTPAGAAAFAAFLPPPPPRSNGLHAILPICSVLPLIRGSLPSTPISQVCLISRCEIRPSEGPSLLENSSNEKSFQRLLFGAHYLGPVVHHRTSHFA